MRDGRADFIFEADYSQGGELESTVMDIIRKMAVTDTLKRRSVNQAEQIGW